MKKTLRIQSKALEEINQAFDWYFQRSPAAAEAFLTEIGASPAHSLHKKHAPARSVVVSLLGDFSGKG